jgi:hypothetical protein
LRADVNVKAGLREPLVIPKKGIAFTVDTV